MLITVDNTNNDKKHILFHQYVYCLGTSSLVADSDPTCIETPEPGETAGTLEPRP